MNKLAHATVGLLERKWLKTATVLAIRVWDPAIFFEIDLHLPDCDMSKCGVSYLGISSSHHQPAPGKRLVFLGDETTIGHFFALHQLAGKHARVEGAIVLAHKHHQHEFSDYFSYLGLQTLDKEGAGRYGELEKWADELKTDGQDTVFYLAGYSPAVVRLRKLLKGKGVAGSQIRCQGFWD